MKSIWTALFAMLIGLSFVVSTFAAEEKKKETQAPAPEKKKEKKEEKAEKKGEKKQEVRPGGKPEGPGP